MKKIMRLFLFVIVGMKATSLSAQATLLKPIQSQAEETAISSASYVGLAAYVTQTLLQVNDMVSDLNELYMKMATLDAQVKLLKAMASNPELIKKMNPRAATTLNIQIQIITMNVRIYGTAIRSLLVAIRKRIQMQSTAIAQRADAEASGALSRLAAQITKKVVASVAKKIPGVSETGIGQGISMLPISDKVGYLSKKQQAAYNLQEACEQINAFSYEVIKYVKYIDALCDSANGLMFAMSSWRGATALMTINAGTSIVNASTKRLKEYEDKKIKQQEEMKRLQDEYNKTLIDFQNYQGN